MGKDLYYIQTPLDRKETLHDLEYSTWSFLAEIMGYEEKEDLQGRILRKDYIPKLETVLATLRACGKNELAKDISKIIKAINKMDSITLVIRG